MTITVDIGDADLSELLAQVEAGEEIILVRGDVPVARISRAVTETPERQRAIEAVRAFRARMPNITHEEISEWKEIGRR